MSRLLYRLSYAAANGSDFSKKADGLSRKALFRDRSHCKLALRARLFDTTGCRALGAPSARRPEEEKTVSQLLSRLFGLFAFRSTRLMLLVFACAFIVLFLGLPLLQPWVHSLSARSRLATLQKLAAVDRSSLKDEKLRQGYDRLLADFERSTRSLAVPSSSPAGGAAAAKATPKISPKPTPKPSPKPTPKASAKTSTSPVAKPVPTKAPPAAREPSAISKGFHAFTGRLFTARSLFPFLCAAALWLILAFASLLAHEASGGARFLAFLLLMFIALASGVLAVFFLPPQAGVLTFIGIAFFEIVLVSALGTLGKELEGGR